jgi:hypothetical protein
MLLRLSIAFSSFLNQLFLVGIKLYHSHNLHAFYLYRRACFKKVAWK